VSIGLGTGEALGMDRRDTPNPTAPGYLKHSRRKDMSEKLQGTENIDNG